MDTHLMIDLETAGNGEDAAMFSLSAVKFDIESGEYSETFDTLIDLQSCFNLGLKPTASTIYWWLQQSEQARRNITHGPKRNIKEVLRDFSDFCEDIDYVWGNSPRFDLGILGTAYRLAQWEIPWNFRNERDLRTILGFFPDLKKTWNYKGVYHNGIDDCYNQIDQLCYAWSKLKIEK